MEKSFFNQMMFRREPDCSKIINAKSAALFDWMQNDPKKLALAFGSFDHTPEDMPAPGA
jgi:hypothetical protein